MYPPNPLEHFQEIHRQLEMSIGVEFSDVPYHRAPLYQGPWIENYWQEWVLYEVQVLLLLSQQSNNNGNNFHTVFGPYIPLIPAWTDLFVHGMAGYNEKDDDTLATALSQVLHPSYIYITVCQNDDGLAGNNAAMQRLLSLNNNNNNNIVVLSAGGYGHVPIPLLKQPEEHYLYQRWKQQQQQRIPVAQRHHLVSYVGSMKHAPHNLRATMMDIVGDDDDDNDNDHYYYGRRRRKWRHFMRDSKFSLCPRGFGRTSYHVMETLQLGLIPIQVYADGDIPWMPYYNYHQYHHQYHHDNNNSSFSWMQNLSFVTDLQGLPSLLERLNNTFSDADITAMEEEIVRRIPDYFTYEGVLQQIQYFLLKLVDDDDNNTGVSSQLQCQPLPKHAGTNRGKYFPN